MQFWVWVEMGMSTLKISLLGANKIHFIQLLKASLIQIDRSLMYANRNNPKEA